MRGQRGKALGKRIFSGILAVILLMSGVGLTASAEGMENRKSVSVQAQQPEDELYTSDGEDLPDEEAAVSVEQDDINMEAANGLGSLLINDFRLAAQAGMEEAWAGYGITQIEVIDTTADVVLHVSGGCTVIVGIYEEGSARPYAFGSASVSVDKSRISVEIDTEVMPEYFEVRGYLVDTDSLRPLSTEYKSVMYTRAMQEFLKKTTADFDEKKVLNLDEDAATNFVVVSDRNILIREQPGAGEDGSTVNVLEDYDEAGRIYKFVNTDGSFDHIRQGSTLVYADEGGSIFIIEVESIAFPESSDPTAPIVITAAESTPDAGDVFSYIKIEEETTLADAAEPDALSCPEGVTYLGRDTAVGYALTNEDDPIGFSVTDKWEVDLGKIESDQGAVVSGKAGGKITLSLNMEVKLIYYLDLSLFDSSAYVDVSVPVAVGLEGTLECEGNLACPLITAPLEIKSDVLTVTYIPKFVVHAGIKATFSKLELEGEMGFKTGFGLAEDESQGAYSDLKFRVGEFSVEAEGYIGVDFNPVLDVKYVGSVELEADVHLGLKAAYTNSGAAIEITTQHEKHSCRNCVNGSMYLQIPLKAKFELFGGDGEIGKDITLWEKSFYYSIDRKQFGWGECPFRSFKIAVRVGSGGSETAVLTAAYRQSRWNC